MDILTEKSDYKGTCNAFKTLGFSTDEVQTIWRTIAAVLHLGNVEFQSELFNIQLFPSRFFLHFLFPVSLQPLRMSW